MPTQIIFSPSPALLSVAPKIKLHHWSIFLALLAESNNKIAGSPMITAWKHTTITTNNNNNKKTLYFCQSSSQKLKA